MDAIYRYQRFIYDASRKYYLLGRDRLIEDLAPAPGGRVLEVACGTGRNLIKAARRYPDATFYGFDISSAMLDTARAAIARNGLADRVIVATGDATDFSGAPLFGVPQFDRVFISYSLSMIPPWRAALQQAYAAVAPGGRLHVVDFGDQAQLPVWFRSGLRTWLAKFSVSPRAELETELAAIAGETGAPLAFRRMFRDYAQRAVLAKP
jgi:S-adenosylmethionine-diacylgycerolhomoserine-N-methlytransferase